MRRAVAAWVTQHRHARVTIFRQGKDFSCARPRNFLFRDQTHPHVPMALEATLRR